MAKSLVGDYRREHLFTLRQSLAAYRQCQVPGMRSLIIHTVLTEVGPDFSKFRSPSAFASWLGLCPNNDIGGGKVLWAGTRKVNNRAAKAFRLATYTLHHSRSVLGDYYRRMRAKLGSPKAITATAHKLARITHHLITTGQAYEESAFAKDETRCKKHAEVRLKAQARALGFQLVPAEN